MMVTAVIETLRCDCLRAPARRAMAHPAARLLAALAVVVGLSGCSVCQQARRTLLQEPAEYSWRYDRVRSLKVYRQWADQAWALQSGSCPAAAGVDEYALGFRDGFVDYVYAGGQCEPPPVPPRQFWNVAWRTPQGAAGAQQWFAGYRHGAQSARDGGYRANGVVQSSYLAGGAAPWDAAEPHAPPAYGGELGAPAEPLPAPPEGADYDDQLLPAPPAPLPTSSAPTLPADEPPVEPSDSSDLFDETPAEPESTEAPTVGPAAEPAANATSAVARFRRAVTTVRFTEPSPTP